jgi:hypothetical protein
MPTAPDVGSHYAGIAEAIRWHPPIIDSRRDGAHLPRRRRDSIGPPGFAALATAFGSPIVGAVISSSPRGSAARCSRSSCFQASSPLVSARSSSSAWGHSRGSAPTVGVRNSDQGLDLRLRNAAAQTCQYLSRAPRTRTSGLRLPCLGARHAELPGLDLSASDSDFILIPVRGQVPRPGPPEGPIGPSLAGGQLGRSRRSQG